MKRPPIPKNKQISIPQAKSFVARNKLLLVWASIILAILLLVGIFKYVVYMHRFSDKDFAAIEQAAENIFHKVGATDIQKYESCHYAAPEKYSAVGLFCGLEMAAYLRYENDQQAIAIGRALERESARLGSIISHMDELYDNPHDEFTGMSVNLAKPLPKEQCQFTVATGRRAGKVSSYLSPKSDGDLIGIDFTCSAQSREEYFPVTYRQGE